MLYAPSQVWPFRLRISSLHLRSRAAPSYYRDEMNSSDCMCSSIREGARYFFRLSHRKSDWESTTFNHPVSVVITFNHLLYRNVLQKIYSGTTKLDPHRFGVRTVLGISFLGIDSFRILVVFHCRLMQTPTLLTNKKPVTTCNSTDSWLKFSKWSFEIVATHWILCSQNV